MDQISTIDTTVKLNYNKRVKLLINRTPLKKERVHRKAALEKVQLPSTCKTTSRVQGKMHLGWVREPRARRPMALVKRVGPMRECRWRRTMQITRHRRPNSKNHRLNSTVANCRLRIQSLMAVQALVVQPSHQVCFKLRQASYYKTSGPCSKN